MPASCPQLNPHSPRVSSVVPLKLVAPVCGALVTRHTCHASAAPFAAPAAQPQPRHALSRTIPAAPHRSCHHMRRLSSAMGRRMRLLVCVLALPADAFSIDPTGFTRGTVARPALRPLVTSSGRHSLMAAAATAGKAPEGASVPSSIVNLAKNIVGAGVLALAAVRACTEPAPTPASHVSVSPAARRACLASAAAGWRCCPL